MRASACLRGGAWLSSHEEGLLASWLCMNRLVLQAYWDGAIDYTEDAIAALKSL
ncbi:hypothetical protein [Beijerinckia sp. L45]|uniref:hypothetical protein n=1 Tax=Beijerinckia sp. L45 TaxID=1641855 RepID=UPI00131C24FB|nr:hypothetical protein [Beijerinckia sp. L45]